MMGELLKAKMTSLMPFVVRVKRSLQPALTHKLVSVRWPVGLT